MYGESTIYSQQNMLYTDRLKSTWYHKVVPTVQKMAKRERLPVLFEY